jgi:16S rRNA (guanine966-N2)-methyltransferase
MRIVGGRLGGRRLKPPTGNVTRPTSERVREALSSALESRDFIAGRRVLELYAGTGALGFEMLSRGASHVTFVEKDPRMARALGESARELAVEAEVRVLALDANRENTRAAILAQGPFSLVLLDPPYKDVPQAVAGLEALCAHGLLADDAVLLLEHPAKGTLTLPPAFRVLNSYRYGDTAVALFVRGGEDR